MHTGAISTYYKAFQVEAFDFEDFHTWMITIDSIWLDQVAERRKKEQAAPKPKPKPASTKRG